MKKYIAISGLSRSGKDTIGEHLIKKYNYKRVSFAESIYDILNYAQSVCGFERIKDRQFLQYIGDWARQKEDDIWINLATNKILKYDKVVVTDVRFKNEMNVLKNLNFILIRVKRDKRPDFGSGSNTHISETELEILPDESFDLVVDNNGTLEELYLKIDKYLK